MTCKKCIHNGVCPHLKDSDAEKCKQYIDKANVVEVVRCENCKHWDRITQECLHWWGFRANDYCSYGERINYENNG